MLFWLIRKELTKGEAGGSGEGESRTKDSRK